MDFKTALSQLDLHKVNFDGIPTIKNGIRYYCSFNDSDYFLNLKNICENPLCLKVFTDKSPFGSSWGSIFFILFFIVINS